MSILTDEDDAIVLRRRYDGIGTAVIDDVDALRRAVAETHVVDAHAKRFTVERHCAGKYLGGFVHGSILTESPIHASYESPVRRRSSVLIELLWLAYFLAIFAIFVYALNIFVVPHHFNDRIAAVMAAVFAGVAMIATRARFARRH